MCRRLRLRVGRVDRGARRVDVGVGSGPSVLRIRLRRRLAVRRLAIPGRGRLLRISALRSVVRGRRLARGRRRLVLRRGRCRSRRREGLLGERERGERRGCASKAEQGKAHVERHDRSTTRTAVAPHPRPSHLTTSRHNA
ncbi:hypothetical protein AKJ09_04119 [Labilithrix luteola]|uniref:Uncharacterized protein n=1 Tax=Labilithrix luteola TaxID=1391654 RepID=A0A0K1PV97_9BACT|nr:hypothetical protein AKJ09_04119 [Labilithrix luteola]